MNNVTAVWEPKHSTQEVLVSDKCIADGPSYVFFTDDNNWPNLYRYDGRLVKNFCEKQQNGKGQVYCIPLSWLSDAGPLPNEFLPMKEAGHKKYMQYQAKKHKKS